VTKTEIYKQVRAGKLTQTAFFQRINTLLEKVAEREYAIGYKAGAREATPKERYQGEFGARSNY
jgi:hypothetical protein